MAEIPMIRFVTYDRDPDTQARTVCDIVEKPAPTRIKGSRSFTALSKDELRRQLLVAFALEVDRMIDGAIDEFSVSMVMTDPAEYAR